MDILMERRPITLYTPTQRIEGELHVPKDARVSDRLNQTRDFIPLTNARVYSLADRLLYARKALIVNKAFIVALDDEPEPAAAPANGVAHAVVREDR